MIFSKKKKILSAMLSLAMIGTMVASVPFTASADTTTATPVEPGVSYTAHVQSHGDLAAVTSGLLGTTGESKRVEALSIKLTGAPSTASITYQVQGQTYGWQAAKSDGAQAGTTGKSKRIEALRITINGLTGYEVQYRAHVQSYGTTGWVTVTNGTAIAAAPIVGTVNQAKRIEAYEVRIVKIPVTTVTVASVSAISATTIEATLTRAATAAEQTATKFAVTRTDSNANTVSVTMTPTFSTDGTKVDLTTGGNLIAGTYNITATAGVTGTGSAVVSAQKVGKIVITSSKMVATGTATQATVPYKVYDQYGADITTSSLSYSIVWTSSISSSTGASSSGTPGTVYITKQGGSFAAGDTAVLSGIDPSTGTNTLATLTWASYSTIASVTFGTPVLPVGVSSIQTLKTTGIAATLPITVTDDQGNTITTPATLANDLIVTSSDSNVNTNIGNDTNKDFAQDANNNAVWNLNTYNMTSASTITVNFIVKSTGKSFSTTFSVVMPASPYSVSFGNFNSTVCVGDTSLTIPITVLDQFGNTLGASDVAADYAQLNIVSSNPAIIANTASAGSAGTLSIARGGSNKGNLILTGRVGATATTSGTTTITVYVTGSSKSATITINAQTQRIPSTMVLPSTFTTNLIGGSSYSFAADYKDQYGNALTNNLSDADSSNTQVITTLTKISGSDSTADELTLTNSNSIANGSAITTTQAQTSSEFTLSSKANVTATYKLAVMLQQRNSGTWSTISEVDKTVNVVKNNVSGLAYAMATIPTIAGDQDYSDTSTGHNTAGAANPEVREISVNAKDASGASYAVPSASIYNVTSSDSKVANIMTDGTNYYVAGNNISTASANETTTITAYVTTDSGVQTFTQTVTVSPSAPKEQAVYLQDTKESDAYTLAGNAVTDVNLSSTSDHSNTVFAYAKDQYGVLTQLVGATSYFTASDTSKYTGYTTTGTNVACFGLVGSSTASAFEVVTTGTGAVTIPTSTDLYVTLFAKTGSVVTGSGATLHVTLS
jgi:uncharacterized protein YjdB